MPKSFAFLASVVVFTTVLFAETGLAGQTTLGAGDYIIEFERMDTCSSGELAISKSRVYGDDMSLEEIRFEATGLVPDNLIRPAVCRAGVSRGKAFVSLTHEATVVAEGMTLVGVGMVDSLAEDDLGPRESAGLNEGRYLVTFSKQEFCTPGEINLTKTLDYGDNFDGGRATVIIGDGGTVTDNLVRPAVCTEGTRHGTLLLEAPGQGFTLMPTDGLMIESIQSLDEAQESTPTEVTLQAGSYIVTVSQNVPCWGEELNVTKSLEYGDDMSLARMILKSAGQASDNLMRPMVCLENAVATAQVPVNLPNGATIATLPTEDGSALEIMSIQKVTRTSRAIRPWNGRATLRKGLWMVTLAKPEGCNPGQVNLSKHTEYAGHMGAGGTIQLKESTPVADNLMHAAVCTQGLKYALALVEVKEGRMAVEGRDGLEVYSYEKVLSVD